MTPSLQPEEQARVLIDEITREEAKRFAESVDLGGLVK